MSHFFFNIINPLPPFDSYHVILLMCVLSHFKDPPGSVTSFVDDPLYGLARRS